MKVVNAFPPNYEVICRAFNIRGKSIVFTYGDTLYAPGAGPIPEHLMAHEETHTRQQGRNVDAWWEQYLVDPQFRMDQELEAYRAQWQVLLTVGRPERRRVLAHICKDLAGSMYGGLCTKERAKMLITGEQNA